MHLAIYDVLGRNISQKNIGPGISQIEIPTQNLSEGTYLIKVGFSTQSFIKVK